VIVTTTTKTERLQEYLDVGDLPSLTEEEIKDIDDAGTKGGISSFTFSMRNGWDSVKDVAVASMSKPQVTWAGKAIVSLALVIIGVDRYLS